GLAFVAFAGSFTLFLVAIAIAGIGQGVYLAIDLALAAAVLPEGGQGSSERPGRPQHRQRAAAVVGSGNCPDLSGYWWRQPLHVALHGGSHLRAAWCSGHSTHQRSPMNI